MATTVDVSGHAIIHACGQLMHGGGHQNCTHNAALCGWRVGVCAHSCFAVVEPSTPRSRCGRFFTAFNSVTPMILRSELGSGTDTLTPVSSSPSTAKPITSRQNPVRALASITSITPQASQLVIDVIFSGSLSGPPFVTVVHKWIPLRGAR